MFKKRKYSEKLKIRANSWLEQFHTSLERLTEDQQIVVLEHIKRRRLKKWLWLACLSGFVWLFAGFYGYFVTINCMEVFAANGIEGMEPSLLRQTILVQYYLSGMCFSCFLVAAFIFLIILMYLFEFKMRENILKAFLTHKK